MEKILEKKCNHICEELPLSSYQSFLARLRIDYFLYTFTQGAINLFNRHHQNQPGQSHNSYSSKFEVINQFVSEVYDFDQQNYTSTSISKTNSSSSKSRNAPLSGVSSKIDLPSEFTVHSTAISPIPPMVPPSAPPGNFERDQTSSDKVSDLHCQNPATSEFISVLKELFDQYSLVYKLTDKDPGFESYLRSWIERYTSFLYVNCWNFNMSILELDMILAVYSVRSKSIWAVNLIRSSIEGYDEEIQLNHILNLLKGWHSIIGL